MQFFRVLELLFVLVGCILPAEVLADKTSTIHGERQPSPGDNNVGTSSTNTLHCRTNKQDKQRGSSGKKKQKDLSSSSSSSFSLSSEDEDKQQQFINTCYSNKLQAGALGTATLTKFFLEIYDTGCDREVLGDVLAEFFMNEFTVSVNGEVRIEGIENVKAAVLGDNTPPGSAIDLCLNHHTSFAAIKVIDNDLNDNTFIWVGNLVSSPLAGGLPGYEIKFVLGDHCNAKLASTNDTPFKPLPA